MTAPGTAMTSPLPAPRPLSLAGNVVAFQSGWFAAVLGAAQGAGWAGPLAAALVVGWHLARVLRPRPEALLVAASLAIGLVLDGLLRATGLVEYRAAGAAIALAPGWILAMWALFATTVNVSLRWLHDRPFTALVFGAAGGPLGYLAGERLGAITLPDPGAACIALGTGWAVAMPLLAALGRRLDGTLAAAR